MGLVAVRKYFGGIESGLSRDCERKQAQKEHTKNTCNTIVICVEGRCNKQVIILHQKKFQTKQYTFQKAYGNNLSMHCYLSALPRGV